MSQLSQALSFTPYTCQPIRTLWFGRTEFGIYFEDTLIRQTTMSYEDVKHIVELLNSAWQLGYGSAYAQLTLESIK